MLLLRHMGAVRKGIMRYKGRKKGNKKNRNSNKYWKEKCNEKQCKFEKNEKTKVFL